jgi:hypothetical protein
MEEGGPRAPARTPPRAPAREEPPPAPTLSGVHQELEEALLDGVDRTPGRWIDRGEPWQRAALLVELEARGLDKLDALKLGRYLATDAAAEAAHTSVFSFDWFVFGKPGAPEFKRLDGVMRRAEEWESARAPKLPPRIERAKPAGRILTPEEVAAKFRAVKARQAAPATTESSALIGDVVDEFLNGGALKREGGDDGR